MNIGLDFDGVVADTSRLKKTLARQFFGVDIPSEIFKEKMVVDRGILTREQYRDLMSKVCGTSEHGLRMEEVSGAIEGLKFLNEGGHKIKIITSRAGSELEIAREWLKQRALEPEFYSVGYGQDKVEAAKSMDFFMDDDLNKLIPLVPYLADRLFLFHQDYNSMDEVPAGVRRITSWVEFIKAIEESI